MPQTIIFCKLVSHSSAWYSDELVYIPHVCSLLFLSFPLAIDRIPFQFTTSKGIISSLLINSPFTCRLYPVYTTSMLYIPCLYQVLCDVYTIFILHDSTMIIRWLYHVHTVFIPWIYHAYTVFVPCWYHACTMIISMFTVYHVYVMLIPSLNSGYTMFIQIHDTCL